MYTYSCFILFSERWKPFVARLSAFIKGRIVSIKGRIVSCIKGRIVDIKGPS